MYRLKRRRVTLHRLLRRNHRAMRILPTALFLFLMAAPAMAGVYGDDRGARPAALEPCDALYDKGSRVEARMCYNGLLESQNLFLRAEAWWGLGNFNQANEVFRAALEAEPANADLRVRWGYLFEQTYNPEGAVELFREALEIDKNHVAAKLGVATVLAKRFDPKSKAAVDEVIAAREDFILAHLLIARLAMEEDELAAAEEHLKIALTKVQANGRSPLETYSMLAALDLLREIPVERSEWTAKALAYNPKYGKIYEDAAHFYVITRRYREAIDLYQKAVEIDPVLYSAHADLGVNLLRENRDTEAYRHLEIAFEGDPFSAKTVNTLRLVDSFSKFKLYSSKDEVLPLNQEAVSLDAPEIRIRLHEKEAQVLKPYVMALAQDSAAKFSKKYNFKPKKPIYVELYPDHDDFAVRTMGMPGVGLLGVTFGYLVAMDSPSSREPGSFHWGTTLWHEMAHVFTLEATNHLVPRWYSEGISMYEEWEARPNWGESITPDFVEAFTGGKLLPVADLDKGFIRPTYENQVIVSYFQAGLICQMIDRQWGSEKLLRLLEAFGRDTPTDKAIQEVLQITPTAFDERLLAYVKELLGPLGEKDGLKNWKETMKQAVTAAGAEKWDEAVGPAIKAKELFPGYVQNGSPYELLAKVYDEKGDRRAAIGELLVYFQRGGREPEQLKKLAGWLEEANRREEAMAVLDEVLYVWPADEELHAELGDWLLADDRPQEALREFNVLLGMNPHDKAAAYFRLAETYHKMNDSQRARRNLLMSLEIAPTYKPAQRLLLEIAR